MRTKRVGLASVLAVAMIAVVGVAGTGVVTHVHFHARRIAAELEMTQLRQLVTAARTMPATTGRLRLPAGLDGYFVDEVAEAGTVGITATGPTRRVVERF